MTDQSHDTSPLPHSHSHHRHQQPLPIPPLISPTSITSPTTTSSELRREYRKGNWTLHETLILITAKRMDYDRRTKSTTTPSSSSAASGGSTSCKTAELRWKWVENYCWKNGCMRSQNQCNDKWDNLLRDYKKVRAYESQSDGSKDFISYWKLEKQQRRERNLPTNLLSEIYEALNEVLLHSRNQIPNSSIQPFDLITTATATPAPTLLVTDGDCPPRPQPPIVPVPPVEMLDSSETEESEKLYTDTKHKRRVHEISSPVAENLSVLAKTLVECEEKKEKRHKHITQLQERRIQIEEARKEINEQGFACLISSIKNLSDAVQELVSTHKK